MGSLSHRKTFETLAADGMDILVVKYKFQSPEYKGKDARVSDGNIDASNLTLIFHLNALRRSSDTEKKVRLYVS